MQLFAHLADSSQGAVAPVIGHPWYMKFILSFIPAFLGTGILFGVLYVLIMRAIRVDRAAVEAWFEKLRLRLHSGPVPVIEWAQPVMLAAVQAVYGRTATRRFLTSMCVGLFFTTVIFGMAYWKYRSVPNSIHAIKAQLERDIDPVLYNYATNPRLRPEYEKSQVMIGYPDGSGATHYEYVYTGGIYDELRDRVGNFRFQLVTRISHSPDRINLTLLTLFEGTCLRTGFSWLDSFFLFAFNILLDFGSVTVAVVCLRRLGRDPCVLRGLAEFGYALVGTMLCAAVAFFSYRLFFGGNTHFFGLLLFMFPFALTGFAIGLWALFESTMALFGFRRLTKETEKSWGMVLVALMLCGIGFVLLRAVWKSFQFSAITAMSEHDFFSFPYILSGTTLFPATLTLVAFSLMLLAKLTAEPARVLPEAYMTFIKEEVGGRQASGIIMILGILIGTIVGLVWPAS